MSVLADPAVSERQKRVLIDIYTSFVRENERAAADQAAAAEPPAPASDPIS